MRQVSCHCHMPKMPCKKPMPCLTMQCEPCFMPVCLSCLSLSKCVCLFICLLPCPAAQTFHVSRPHQNTSRAAVLRHVVFLLPTRHACAMPCGAHAKCARACQQYARAKRSKQIDAAARCVVARVAHARTHATKRVQANSARKVSGERAPERKAYGKGLAWCARKSENACVAISPPRRAPATRKGKANKRRSSRTTIHIR